MTSKKTGLSEAPPVIKEVGVSNDIWELGGVRRRSCNVHRTISISDFPSWNIPSADIILLSIYLFMYFYKHIFKSMFE